MKSYALLSGVRGGVGDILRKISLWSVKYIFLFSLPGNRNLKVVSMMKNERDKNFSTAKSTLIKAAVHNSKKVFF